jgi:RND family efflux transporter MFP subunit
MTRKRIMTILVPVLVAGTLLTVRHLRVVEKNDAAVLASPVVAVEIAVVRHGALDSVDHVLGVVRGADEADIAPRIPGEVTDVLVREGDRVARGAVLARLDTKELEDAVAAAEANLEAARVAREAQVASTSRDRVLFDNDAISQEQWEHSQAATAAASARFEVAQRHRDQAQARLGYAVARAPFDGVVSARFVDPGSMGVPGRPMLRIVRQSAVRVRGTLPPALMTMVDRGTPVDLALGDRRVKAQVTRVFPAMEGSHLAMFEVDLPDPPSGFVAGATVGIDLHIRSGEGLVVPADALLEGETGAYAFVVERDTIGVDALRVVPVTVTTRSLDGVIVEGDLHAGNTVVVARPSRLMELSSGMSVHPVDAVPGR